MTRNSGVIAVVILSLSIPVAALVASHFAYRAGKQMGVSDHLDTHWLALIDSDSVHATDVVAVLQLIRANRCPEAIPRLEQALDSCVASMASHYATRSQFAEQPQQLELWREIKRYRQAHPSDLADTVLITDFWQAIPD